MTLDWTTVPGGIFARAPLPNGGRAEYTCTRHGEERYYWVIAITLDVPVRHAKRGRPRKGSPRVTQVTNTTETFIRNTSLAEMKQISQDDYDERTRPR